MASLPWFKVYVEDMLHDERTWPLSDGARLFFWLAQAVARTRRGNELGVIRLDAVQIAAHMRRPVEWVSEGLAACIAAELVELREDGSLFLPDFSDRQPGDRKPEEREAVTARKRRWRDAKRVESRNRDAAESRSRDGVESRNGEEKRSAAALPAAPSFAPANYGEEFEAWWGAYPPNNGTKARAAKLHAAWMGAGEQAEALLAAASNYAASCRQEGTDRKFVKHAETFLAREAQPWREWITRAAPVGRYPSGYRRAE